MDFSPFSTFHKTEFCDDGFIYPHLKIKRYAVFRASSFSDIKCLYKSFFAMGKNDKSIK